MKRLLKTLLRMTGDCGGCDGWECGESTEFEGVSSLDTKVDLSAVHDHTHPEFSASCHNNTKPISPPTPTRLQTATISTISFHPPTREAASSENTPQLWRGFRRLPFIILPRVTVRRSSHIRAPKRRTPLPDIPRHVVTSIERTSLGEESDGTGLIETCFFAVGNVALPLRAPGI